MNAVFTLTIDMGNDAMSTLDDVAEALRKVSDRVAAYNYRGVIRDANGNVVGHFNTENAA